MPVIHDYTDGSGIYLNSNIDGSFITLQATPAAESFLRDLGYTDSDSVSWQLIKPLWEQGHIYTGGSGKTAEVADITKSQLNSSSLNRREKDKLEEFLSNDSLSVDVPKDIHGALRKWSTNPNYSNKETAEFLDGAANQAGTIKSIRHLAWDLPINVKEARMSGSGNPVYSFSTGGRKWTATDLRWIDHPCDWVFTVCPGDGFTQLFNISPKGVDWVAVDNGEFQEKNVRDALLVYADVVWFCNEVSGHHPETSSWDLTDRVPEELPDEYLAAVEEVSTAATTGTRDGETEGIVLSFDEKEGYGRLQTVDYQTIPFSEQEYDDPDEQFELQEGLAVSLKIQPHRGTEYAFDIEPTRFDGKHLFVHGLPQNDENDSSFADTTSGSDTEIPEKVHNTLADWCGDTDDIRLVEEQVAKWVNQEGALYESVRDFESCDRIVVKSFTITRNGTPRYQIGFQEQGVSDTWEVTHDITEGPIKLDIKLFPSQAPVQEARLAEGLVEYWRLAPLSEELNSGEQFRTDPRIRRHRYNLCRSQSVRLFKRLVRDLETVSLAVDVNQSESHIDSIPDVERLNNGE
ncbi:hypothetical protein [Salinigranum marinum]|uniref:hypothetical protein n=1 Tax=Salinigranum marinum TaxID=1515595 RepID=UPI002989EB2A|nr:hypothetical protein [Salinigranum marinum]